MRVLLVFLMVILCVVAPYKSWAEEVLPRTIIALYNKNDEIADKYSNIHRMAEMPLNHLGLRVEIIDVNEGLPDIKDRQDVRGVLTWFLPGMTMEDPEAYINWANSVIDAGKKFVVMESPGFYQNNQEKPTPIKVVNKFWNQLGVKDNDAWVEHTYDIGFSYKNKELVEFERKYIGYKQPFLSLTPVKSNTASHLITNNELSHLIVTSPQGGYVAEGYVYYYSENEEEDVRQWYVNPFAFFRLAFATDDLPKPDIATMAGRRIYYSHIDGDGWLSLTQMEEYRKKPVYTSKIILDNIIKPYEDLPVSVAAIGREIDPKWVEDERIIEEAKELFSLPQVELATHTYSHPFTWSFFEDYTPEKEERFLHLYPQGSWKKTLSLSWYHRWFNKDIEKTGYGSEGNVLKNNYKIPRAYANDPFSLEQEINESVRIIESLAPEGKKVKMIMWSGDTLPFEGAIAHSRINGLRNINGGDNRFDREYPSYAWVSPVGRRVGNEYQIYASNSNENTYTDLWTGRYHGFKYLVQTIENTETPIRLKPFNIYYHMYSGEKLASLNALRKNIEYAREQEIAPITASNYTRIADGFNTVKMYKENHNQWRIKQRDGLQTIRFDNHLFKMVDFMHSKGVVGQRHFQGSLYVYLDEKVEEPVIALKRHKEFYQMPKATTSYLVHSRWKIYNMARGEKKTSFTAQGFGKGNMVWYVPSNGKYTISVNNKPVQTLYVNNNMLEVTIDDSAISPVNITVRQDA